MQRNVGRAVRFVSLAAAAFGLNTACPRQRVEKPPTMRDRLLASATSHYSYLVERPPWGTRPPGVPTMTIASARMRSGFVPYPGSRFVGRITSRGRYRPLGIAPGMNYIWTDSASATATDTAQQRVLIVPVDRQYPMFWLKVDSIHAPRPRSGDSRGHPEGLFRLAAWSGPQASGGGLAEPDPLLRYADTRIEACSDGCPTGHCANSTTLREYAATDDPTMHVP